MATGNNWWSLETWIHGLVGAFIGGGAAGVTGALTSIGIDPQQYNLGSGLKHTLEIAGAMFVVNGIVSALLYLKQSPVPNLVPDSEQK